MARPGSFANPLPNPRRSPGRPAADIPVTGRGTLPPATVGGAQAADQGLSLSRIAFDRSDFKFDGTRRDVSVRTQANAALSRWSRVGGADQLRCYIGATDVPLYVHVWGVFAWKCDSVDDEGHARVTAGLYHQFDDMTQVNPDIWAENSTYGYQHNDQLYQHWEFIGRFLVPAGGGNEWGVGLLHQFNAGSTRANQHVYAQNLMTIVGAYPATGEAATDDSELPDGDE